MVLEVFSNSNASMFPTSAIFQTWNIILYFVYKEVVEGISGG